MEDTKEILLSEMKEVVENCCSQILDNCKVLQGHENKLDHLNRRTFEIYFLIKIIAIGLGVTKEQFDDAFAESQKIAKKGITEFQMNQVLKSKEAE